MRHPCIWLEGGRREELRFASGCLVVGQRERGRREKTALKTFRCGQAQERNCSVLAYGMWKGGGKQQRLRRFVVGTHRQENDVCHSDSSAFIASLAVVEMCGTRYMTNMRASET